MIEMFFVVGSLAFWILAVVAALALLLALENDSGWWATGILVAFVATFIAFGNGMDTVNYVRENPSYILGGFAAYLLVGGGWGIAKWALTVRKLARQTKEIYQTSRLSFLQRIQTDVDDRHRGVLSEVALNEETAVPAELQERWLKTPIHNYGPTGNLIKQIDRDKQGRIVAPRARDYKSSILLWMSFWPLSALWTALDDLIKELFENIYQYLSSILQSIADRAFAGIIQSQELDLAQTGENKPESLEIDE